MGVRRLRTLAFTRNQYTQSSTMVSEQLLSEIEAGQGETLSCAAQRMPRSRRGRPVTLSCVLRWVTEGVNDSAGTRIKLEAARLAGKWVTTPGAIRRFIAAQTPKIDSRTAPIPRRTPHQRKSGAEPAEKQLECIVI
jgi:hypothetical protein